MPTSIYIRGGVAAAGGGQQSQTCAPAADPGAIISCNCEKVKLKFTVAQPRMRLECCCVDCKNIEGNPERKVAIATLISRKQLKQLEDKRQDEKI